MWWYEGFLFVPHIFCEYVEGCIEAPCCRHCILSILLSFLVVYDDWVFYCGIREDFFILTFGLPACLVQSRKPAKFVRPTALWWEDAGLSACSLAMIKVRLVLKETLFHFILLSNILRFIPDGSFIFSSAVHLQQAGMRVPWSWRACLMSLIGTQTNDC